MLDHSDGDAGFIGQRGAELGIGDIFRIRLDSSIPNLDIGSTENDACASGGRLQDKPGLFTTVHTDTRTYCGPRNRLLKFYTTGQHTNLQFHKRVWGVCRQDTKHGLFRRVTKRAKTRFFAL